ncbi:alpha-glucan family phosphorylase [Flagellimonas pacifica]|uniref:Starch phosphorylase n=1 Tax=Flagellimonas pacifica TaxID=1247520 RepID=A0A285MW21_9FLAO|nr:alpha-glucan family phosphorylase [Allomuricauda parva]SNZ01384.1 starch phosphorylase [Allomuricauda parva]
MNLQLANTDELYGLIPKDIEGMDSLVELAFNIRWSWNHASDKLWQQLDPELWKLTQNPWVILQTVSRDRLQRHLEDPEFRSTIKTLLDDNKKALSSPNWFQQNHPKTQLKGVAYFSMEYMLSEALPIYAGGLGNVAGDQLKSASDLGVPVTAVGLLYAQGYFRQEIDKNGIQNALFPYNDPGQLPIRPLRLPNGEWLRIKVPFPGHPLWLRAWQVQVGRLKLYLLDSNDASNLPEFRGITDELYGGGPEQRIKQEIALGIGGYKLLRALDLKPEVCHMNEGHAAFLVLERANDFMKQTGRSFKEALAVTRAGNLFTTHTAVPAGFDHFSYALMEKFFQAYAEEELDIDFTELMEMGQEEGKNPFSHFNMAYLATRGSGAVNGVSQLHGKVSRNLFRNLFPRWPVNEIPIGHVTNGVHMPSWDSEHADALWTEACGKDRWRGELDDHAAHISNLGDEKLWKFRNLSRERLVGFIQERFERQSLVSGLSPDIVRTALQIFDPNTLTLGFARRFVTYKRPDLLLHDPQRFIRILKNPERPVQLVMAGKAPPTDESGKALIRKWIEFIQKHELYEHVAFLSDYDMMLTEHLVRGVDVWLNTPRRPWEASGTSGMKVLVNGGINLSVLDGWWAEAYTPEVGWALGDGHEHGNGPAHDAQEAEALYRLLENEVVPEFYDRNKKKVPERWVERIRKSMADLTSHFSANRTVREYTEHYYLPAAKSYKKRAARKGLIGKRIVEANNGLNTKWHGVKFGKATIKSNRNTHEFEVPIWLNGMDPEHILVELFAEGLDGEPAERIKMKMDWMKEQGEHNYHAKIVTSRPTDHYTVRILPKYAGVTVPLEDNLILWQH